MLRETFWLVRKEFLLEWKQRYTFGGLLLYVVSTVFVCYLSFRKVIGIPEWIALFWIILLFASVNAIAKSFMQENRARNIYYYSLANPVSVIFSKMIYNTCLLWMLAFIHLGFYSLLIGNPVQDMPSFILSMVLGCTGLSSLFTMVSAISAKAGSNSTLMAILGFPVMLPLLLICIRMTKAAADGLNGSTSMNNILMVSGLIVSIQALSFILFPYLWRE